MSKRVIALILAAVLTLTGCSFSKQNIESTTVLRPGDTVCVPPDSSNRRVAYNALIRGLEKRGLVVVEMPTLADAFAQPAVCRYVLKNDSVSKWDMALFVRDLNYVLYADQKPIARADFYAGAGLNFGKFNNTEKLVNRLLDELLPGL